MVVIRWRFRHKKKYLSILGLITFLFGIIAVLRFVTSPTRKYSELVVTRLNTFQKSGELNFGRLDAVNLDILAKENKSRANDINSLPILLPPIQKAFAVEDEDDILLSNGKFPAANYEVHAFYYAWYAAPPVDNGWKHWNHPFIPHWDKQEALKWPSGRHQPPDDIGSNFYPYLGPYSSRNPKVLEDHVKQLRAARIGTIAISWYPPGMADDNGAYSKELLSLLLQYAHTFLIKVCFHIEPYKGRDGGTLKSHIAKLLKDFGSHPAVYKTTHKGRLLPVIYMYDSYMVSQSDWVGLLKPGLPNSLRFTEADAIFLGLVVEQSHMTQLANAGFDGFYTYFASDGFTFGSSMRNWREIANFARQRHLIFSPSVGPGYVDVRVRPWNSRNMKEREHGGYYEQAMHAAIATKPQMISITSFNEWHEGTQIEKAVPFTGAGHTYMDYSPQNPDYYLKLTRKWVRKFTSSPLPVNETVRRHGRRKT